MPIDEVPSLSDFPISKSQRTLLFTGAGLFIFGFLSFGVLLLIEMVLNMRARVKAIELYDEMIIPPRCEQKAIEIDLTRQPPWKEYFYREEPFFNGAD
ncbi:hypothetical protein L596_015380 [Steinernema carpocapsae]|uniref:Uncharacterized protein n=1 Tax=Steinernema carpocapsae TaxID=34508 RepID=A0A4U5NFP7_STECR|nr:hypothetical protein L596_015380 [Steinernema carpocapsae]